jgi:acyl-CoA hydrolase
MCPCWSCPPAALDRRTKTISRTITGLVADGACLQMGVGALPNLVCEGGKSIIATRSTAAGGKISRIVPRLEGPVTTPRIDTHYIVTEFGAVNLKGKSSTERAHALIGLAHPEFRDELTEAARKLHLI